MFQTFSDIGRVWKDDNIQIELFLKTNLRNKSIKLKNGRVFRKSVKTVKLESFNNEPKTRILSLIYPLRNTKL
jgi:hypothetical protein